MTEFTVRIPAASWWTANGRDDPIGAPPVTIPRNGVKVSTRRVHGVLLWYWACRSCHWLGQGHPSALIVGTNAHRHARECRDA